MIASVDIPYEELNKAINEIKKKKNICKHLPQSRFFIRQNMWFNFNGLICDNREHKMGGHSTGVGAEYCKNCKIKNKTK